METKQIASTTIGWMPMPEHERSQRRDAERRAVAFLLQRLGCDSRALAHTEHGAPVMPGLHISITHSRLLAMVAIDKERTIGIDAEEQRPTLLKVKTKFVSPAEETWAADTDLLRLWTVKEAVYKAAGTPGLAFTAIDTSPDWSTATACGLTYKLHFLRLAETMVCLAKRLWEEEAHVVLT